MSIFYLHERGAVPQASEVKRFQIIDTETLPADLIKTKRADNPLFNGVVEVSIREVDEHFNGIALHHSLINPRHTICPSVSGIHNITDEDVADSPTLGQWVTQEGLWEEHHDPVWFIAYNAAFDYYQLRNVLVEQGLYVCDVLNLARLYYPEAPDHKMQTMRYYLGVHKRIDELEAQGVNVAAHSADGDTLVLQLILEKMAQDQGKTLLEMCIDSAQIPVPEKINFGKHRGKAWSEVAKDRGYMAWLKNNITDRLDVLAVLAQAGLIEPDAVRLSMHNKYEEG